MPRRIAAPAFFTFLLGLLIQASCEGGTFVQFRTIFGTIEAELYDQDKPQTVENFLRYLRSGRYRDIFIHRCAPNFVVQAGAYYTVSRTSDALMDTATVMAHPRSPTITNEYSVGRPFSNVYGTLAMARVGGMTNSATSEWFFNTANNTFLDNVDGGFTVFGRVLRGTNVLNTFNTFRYTNGLIDLRHFVGINNFGTLFRELPVIRPGYFDPPLSALVYVDISVLNVQVARTSEASEITWNSVVGRTNRVEYTTSFPPAWTTLVLTNGTGNSITVQDTNSTAATRFYRVQVEY